MLKFCRHNGNTTNLSLYTRIPKICNADDASTLKMHRVVRMDRIWNSSHGGGVAILLSDKPTYACVSSPENFESIVKCSCVINTTLSNLFILRCYASSEYAFDNCISLDPINPSFSAEILMIATFAGVVAPSEQ